MSPDQTVLPPRETTYSGNAAGGAAWCPFVPEAAAGKYYIQTATNVDAIEDLRNAWSMWTHSLDTDIDYYLHRISHGSTKLEPYVIVVYCDGGAVAMLIGQIKNRRASAIISFVNIPGPRERVLEIRRGARIGQPSDEVDRLLALELVCATKRGEIDSVCFERLPLRSELFNTIRDLRSLRIGPRVPHIFCYSVLTLSDSEKERPQLFSGKIGREIRRKKRLLDRTFPGQVSLKCFSQPGELDAGICDALRVAVTTWQHSMGLGHMDSDETLESFRFFAEREWLRIFILYLGDDPCAFLTGALYNSTFHCQFAGYRPDYARFSVGSVLTARAFEALAAAGVNCVDLGEGGQEHNRRLGCQLEEEGTVHVYSPTLRGLMLNVFSASTQIVRKSGRRTQSALRLNRLSITWRQFLQAKRKPRQSSLRSYIEKPL